MLERGAGPGGLAASLVIDGAVFDWGGHSFHTPHPEVRRLVFESLDMHEQRRRASCLVRGQLIPYPFQQHFRELADAEVVEECARGLAERRNHRVAANFEEFLLQRFGSGLARHFLLPYNRKLWGQDLTRLDWRWAGERVAGADGGGGRTAAGARTPLAADTTVAYPARGGFGEIYAALSRRVADIRFDQTVCRVDPRARTVLTGSGEVFRWDRLISTLPLPALVNLVDGMPDLLRGRAQALEAVSLWLAFVVIGRRLDTEVQRIYSAEPHIPAHKLVLNHNSSPYLRDLPHHGVVVEVAGGAGQDAAALTAGIVRGLVEAGVVRDPGEIRRIEFRHVKHGYPAPTLDREASVAAIREWLEAHGVHPVGRFGEWAYINSDEALHRGLRLGRRLAGQEVPA